MRDDSTVLSGRISFWTMHPARCAGLISGCPCRDGVCGVRWHDIAFPRRDMSRRTKARTCPRTPKADWRGRNLEGGFLPNAATPKRTGRALRNSQFAIRNGEGFFSGFHFGLDDWGNLGKFCKSYFGGNGRRFRHSVITLPRTNSNHLSPRKAASSTLSFTSRSKSFLGCISLCRSLKVFSKSSNLGSSYLSATCIAWAFAYTSNVFLRFSRIGG